MFSFVLAVTSALTFSFLCSMSEAVLLSLTHAQIAKFGDSRVGRILRKFKQEIDAPIAAILVLNTVAHTIGAAVAGASYGEVFDESTLWIFSLAFTLAVLLLTEIVPKTLGVSQAARFAPFVALFVNFLTYVLKPVLFITHFLSSLLRRGNPEKPVTSVEEIRLLAMLGRTEGAVGAMVAGMIEGATLLKELTAYDVMVPRGGVKYLSGNKDIEENLEVIRRSNHSRFPFTKSGNLDEVEGVVLVKELMFQLRESPDEPRWEKHLQPLVVVPESMLLDQLLRKFQEERRHMAIVVDEYGGTTGIVTLEDVLEEIVGEIEDETDRIDRFVQQRPNGNLVCRGMAETRKVFDRLNIQAEDLETVTIGGFVAEQLGRVPKAGDAVEFGGFTFKVLAASPKRAERVEIRQGPRSMVPPS
ncbi:MAG: hemolysin family protein [Polyangiaceae bacterium]